MNSNLLTYSSKLQNFSNFSKWWRRQIFFYQAPSLNYKGFAAIHLLSNFGSKEHSATLAPGSPSAKLVLENDE